MCTKLIIASRIKRVVYVQPYVKSLARELFKDSIVFEGIDGDKRVNFESLKGVTPAGFKRAFATSDRRKNDDGSAATWDKLAAKPKSMTTVPYYVNIEEDILTELAQSPAQEISDAFRIASGKASSDFE